MNAESKRHKSISRSQIEYLVSFMEKNQELVSGQVNALFPFRKKQRLWEELKRKLNSINPSIYKTADRWKKTWTDKKSHVRSKAALYKKYMNKTEKNSEDDDKCPRFTPLEKRIMKLIGLKQLSEDCPTADSRYVVPLDAEDEWKTISGSLLPTRKESQITESMEIDPKEPSVNEAFKPIPVTTKETLILENSSLLLYGEPANTKESASLEENVSEQLMVKQEPLDDINETSSSPAAEPQNPIIVSVAPVITTEELPSSIVKLVAPGLTEREEPQSPVVGSLAPSTEDQQSCCVINTAQGTNGESQPDSVNLITSTEKPQLETLHDDPKLVRRRRRRVNKNTESVATKAADALTAMAERNCTVLERIATALEIQAAQSVKQTQLIDQLINILSKK